jgi:hypothetical protein
MPPTTYKEWVDVAKERAADASALAASRPLSVASIYLAGYSLECVLKAYLNRRGIPFPGHGHEGHNLRGLWRRAEFRMSDLKDRTGAKSFFVESWESSMRYETVVDSDLDAGELVDSAIQLMNWLFKQVKRHRRRNR